MFSFGRTRHADVNLQVEEERFDYIRSIKIYGNALQCSVDDDVVKAVHL